MWPSVALSKVILVFWSAKFWDIEANVWKNWKIHAFGQLQSMFGKNWKIHARGCCMHVFLVMFLSELLPGTTSVK